VLIAHLANSQEMVEPLKTLDAEQPLKTAMLKDKFNWIKLHAIDAQPVPVDKDLLVTFAKHQDQPVLATKSMTKQLINAETAQLVNCQETVELTKMEDVLKSPNHATKMDKDNCLNNNAIHAQLVEMDKFLEVTTNALSQDQPAHATKQLTQPLTNAKTAQLDNLVSTKVHANQLHSDVTEMVEFN
jgi:hypothetical protein